MSYGVSRLTLGVAITASLIIAACQTPAPAPPPSAPEATPAPAAATSTQPPRPAAHVELLQGTGEWRPDALSPWSPIVGPFDLATGASLRTGPQGQADVRFVDGSSLKVD